MSNVAKREPGAKIVVWFDRPRDCLCFANRLDEKIKEGDAIPDECIIRIPLIDCEDFVEVIINSAYKTTLEDDSDFWKIMNAIQKLLDQRATDAIVLAERLRAEWAKRSQGVVEAMSNCAQVRVDEWIKLQNLREEVLDTLERFKPSLNSQGLDEPRAEFVLRDLRKFVEENNLDEPRDLPHP